MAQLTDGHDNVRIAILTQAVSDYKRALKSKHDYTIINYSNYMTVVSAKELEKWFLSGWGQMLSDGHGQDIIDKVRKETGK